MRHKFYFGLLLIFFLENTNLFAQNFWVPDYAFRTKLKQLYPTCFTAQDSLITNCSQIQNAINLNVSGLSIYSLNGLHYFSSLDSLNCNYNFLNSLPLLPASLTKLYCTGNSLASLPILPTSLTKLICNVNQLNSLPTLTPTLEQLSCSRNNLSSLPALPASLTYLDCFDNQLTSLPVLPSVLKTLACSYNQLSSLPALPASLFLNCSDNQLSFLPTIPGKVYKLHLGNNPITCFPDIAPRLPGSVSWQNIFTDNTLLSCIPNLGTFPPSIVLNLQTLPLCSPANNSCNYNYTYGHVFLDANGNGNKDSLEKGLEVPVYYSGNSGVFPDSSGFFNAASDTGNISFQVSLNNNYYTSTTPSPQTIHVASGIVDTIYFGLHPIPNINDLKVNLTSFSFIRPGFNVSYKLQYQNVGTDTLYNVQVKFLKPLQLSNLTSQPSANSVNGDTLIWNITSLIPYQQGDVVINDSVFANAVLGDTAKAFAWIEPWVGDTTPVNNSAASITIIGGSYDPNDKSVSVDSVLPNSTDNLEYTIRFQNTGTDTAFTVTLLDKLSGLLDISSMHMISASHSYELSIVNGFAKWIFKNILLPDSNSKELESHGFVKFGIKPKPGLTVTDSIQNKADIYFDYNAAVTTNTIVVNVLNPLQVKDLKETELQIFPNPVQESILIVNQHAGALGKIELINANGKVLETKTISTSTFTWNLQHLPAGTYILKGLGWGQKVVKE